MWLQWSTDNTPFKNSGSIFDDSRKCKHQHHSEKAIVPFSPSASHISQNLGSASNTGSIILLTLRVYQAPTLTSWSGTSCILQNILPIQYRVKPPLLMFLLGSVNFGTVNWGKFEWRRFSAEITDLESLIVNVKIGKPSNQRILNGSSTV